jgi:hypothetical protein
MKKVSLLFIVVLFASLAFSQTKTEIKPADLSKNISAYIAKNFSGYGVERAFKVDNKGVMSTEVRISKGAERLALTFDKDFKLTKKESLKPDLRMPPAKEENKPTTPVKK